MKQPRAVLSARAKNVLNLAKRVKYRSAATDFYLHRRPDIALMSALSLHLLLHMQWIACMVRGKPREGSGIRLALGMLGLASLLALALAPFLSSTVRMPRGRVLEQRQHSAPLR